WIFANALPADKYTITLSDVAIDAAGNMLDGEFTNPARVDQTGTSAFPSGDGASGGNFVFRCTILPGDADRNGIVNSADYNQVLFNVGQWNDMNGDGTVNGSDLAVVNANMGLYFYSYVHGDINLDGAANNLDVQAMNNALTDGPNYLNFMRI